MLGREGFAPVLGVFLCFFYLMREAFACAKFRFSEFSCVVMSARTTAVLCCAALCYRDNS